MKTYQTLYHNSLTRNTLNELEKDLARRIDLVDKLNARMEVLTNRCDDIDDDGLRDNRWWSYYQGLVEDLQDSIKTIELEIEDIESTQALEDDQEEMDYISRQLPRKLFA